MNKKNTVLLQFTEKYIDASDGVLLPLQALAVTTTGYNYIGADSEMVQWSDDDGSAANEPMQQVSESSIAGMSARITAQAEQIGALVCRIEQLEREKQDWIDAWTKERSFWRKFYAEHPEHATVSHETPTFPASALKHSR